MLKTNGHCLVYLIISTSLLFGACVPSKKSVKARSLFETGVSDKKIHAEIARLKSLTKDKNGEIIPVDTYLRLAILYSTYQNKTPDYLSALTALKKYMAIPGRGENESEINTLHSLLLKIQHSSDNNKIHSRNRALIKKNKALTKRTKELTKKNEALKETIEKLGRIDLNLEQKRKSYK